MPAASMPRNLTDMQPLEPVLEPSPQTQAAALEQMLPQAEALPADAVMPARLNEDQVYGNVVRGYASLEPFREQVEKLPGYGEGFLLRWKFLALALLAIARQIALLTDRTEESQVDATRMRLLRMLMMRAWEACALAGHVALEPLEKIVAGTSQLNFAQDVIDLVALFRGSWDVLKDKTPLTLELLDEADALGHAARERLALVGTLGKTQSEALKKLIDRRNRLWTLLVRTHDLARRAGILLFGEQKAATKTPTLQSRQGLPSPKRPAKAPAAPAAE